MQELVREPATPVGERCCIEDCVETTTNEGVCCSRHWKMVPIGLQKVYDCMDITGTVRFAVRSYIEVH